MVEASRPRSVRPMTASGRAAHEGVPVCHDYMKDDITKNLSAGLQKMDRVASTLCMTESLKYQVFKEWLITNGAVFDDVVQFPAVFEGGLEGLAAKEEIGTHKAYIFIPNNLIISVARAQACPELRDLFKNNVKVFGPDHPDRE